MKFYGLAQHEIQAVKSYNKNKLNNKGIKAFKSNSNTITIECDNNEVIEFSITCTKVEANAITFAELDNFMNEYKIAPFLDIRETLYFYENTKNIDTSSLHEKIELRKELLKGLKTLAKIEEIYNKNGIKLKVIEFSSYTNTYLKESVTIRVSSKRIFIEYNRERDDIICPSFTIKDLITLTRKEIKRIEKELHSRNLFTIDDPEIVKLVKEYKKS